MKTKPCPHCLEYAYEIQDIITNEITAWGKHFNVDTSCVHEIHSSPIHQQIRQLLTQLYLEIEKKNEN